MALEGPSLYPNRMRFFCKTLQGYKGIRNVKGSQGANPLGLAQLISSFSSSDRPYSLPPLGLLISSFFLAVMTLISSVQFSHSDMSDSLQPHRLQHSRPPCPSPTPGAYPNSSPLSQWCHPTISSSLIPFSSCLQSFPASGAFQMSQLLASGGQSIGVLASTSVLPMSIQDWFPLGWTGWVSLQSKGLSRVFTNTTVQKNQFFGTQLSL